MGWVGGRHWVLVQRRNGSEVGEFERGIFRVLRTYSSLFRAGYAHFPLETWIVGLLYNQTENYAESCLYSVEDMLIHHDVKLDGSGSYTYLELN